MKAVIFDMDGVLIDTFEAHRKGFDVVMRRRYGFGVGREEFLGYFGMDPRDITAGLLKAHGVSEMPDFNLFYAEKQREFRRMTEEGVIVLPGVRELLEKLRKENFRIALASSTTLKSIIPLMEKTGLKGYFQAFTGMEDTKKAKPEPEVYLKAAEKLGVPPADCWVIEDSLPGIEAGRKAGMRVVGVQTGMRSERELLGAGADFVVKTLEELDTGDLREKVE